jgi:hypothetical protein
MLRRPVAVKIGIRNEGDSLRLCGPRLLFGHGLLPTHGLEGNPAAYCQGNDANGECCCDSLSLLA